MERYDRQIRIPGFGPGAQARLRSSSVMVVGLGGLGCAAAMYLAAAGIGRMLLVDAESVELSNLNRQVLHWTRDIGRLKVRSASEKLRELNPEVEIEELPFRLSKENVQGLVSKVGLVVDGLDNFKTRFLVNEACVRALKPYIYAGVQGFEGRVMTILPGKGPCLRCLIPSDPPEPSYTPVIGAAPGIAALIEVMEVVKLITGVGEPLIGRLLVFDGLYMTFQEVRVERRPDCPVCSSLSNG
ncbi:MAG: HesA/MoeB/ThiF family protein [Candidatus Nezhaarchaeota archaeon]|nr:HesA/MoeB/ThiF family protein [Candidatus Nezhaarchaeota archaeon]